MAGDTSCYWAPWFRSNYKDWDRAPDDFDLSNYQIAHSRLLSELRGELKGSCDLLTQEQQNAFYWKRSSGLTVGGTPDLVAVDGSAACVYDAKTGRPRVSDKFQVMLYMRCLPEAKPEFQGKTMRGRLVYEDRHTVEISDMEIVGEFESHLTYFLNLLDTDVPADKVPSVAECRFCNIGKRDCPDRMETLPELGLYPRD